MNVTLKHSGCHKGKGELLRACAVTVFTKGETRMFKSVTRGCLVASGRR